MTTVTSRFDQHALDALPSRAPFVERLRARSFDAFEALPIPSQETEEWRYTDLEGLDLDLQPFAEGGGPEAVNRHGILAGVLGERAGLQIRATPR